MSALPTLPESAEQAYIDQAIAKNNGRPGALAGHSRSGAGAQSPQVSSGGNAAVRRREAGHSALAHLQRRDFLRAVQPAAAGRQHHLHLPRHGLPHAQLAQPAGEPSPGTGPGARTTKKRAGDADKLALTTPDGKFTVRTVACFGQCALAPVVEINHRICGHVNERTLQREVRALERESE